MNISPRIQNNTAIVTLSIGSQAYTAAAGISPTQPRDSALLDALRKAVDLAIETQQLTHVEESLYGVEHIER